MSSGRGARAVVVALGAASHPGPTIAVTTMALLLAVGRGAGPASALVVLGAVLTGQLSIGWSNDLIDAHRDRQVGRLDKPVASGAVPEALVRAACAAAVLATVPLSLATGLVGGALHLLGVAAGWAYNLGVKSTAWSWAPYAVAFGVLPVYVFLAASPDEPVPWWLPVAGALLGVGAHLVNVLPDLDDDVATGVRGLPHRLGAHWTPRLAAVALAGASVVLLLGAHVPVALAVPGLVVVLGAAGTAWLAKGRTPFRAAIIIALLDVVLLVASG